MNLEALIYILVGSFLGLILRLYIRNHYRQKISNKIDSSSIVNILASFFLGILLAIEPKNINLFLLFYVGFLGCLSTFSSFIYQLFNLIKDGRYLSSLVYYIKVITLSFLFFCLGNIFILIFKS